MRTGRYRSSPLVATTLALILVGAPGAAAAQSWNVSEELHVGPPELEFGALTDVALDSAGRLWIADGMAGELYVSEGGPVRRVATAGGGPGELRPGAIELVVLPGDTVLVIEPQTRRMHRFSADGVYSGTISFSGEEEMTGGWRLLPGGGLAARVYPATVIRPGESPPANGDPVRAFTFDGRAGAVLSALPPTESFRMGAGSMPIITLLAPQPLWDVDALGRVLIASTHAYEVRAHTPSAAPVLVVREAVAGRRIGGDLQAAARELLRETLAQRRTPPAVMERMVADARMADEGPVLGGIMAGPAGTVWLQEAAATGDDLLDLERPGGSAWRIYDAQGKAVGTATFPRGVRPVEWRGDRLAAIARDELGRTWAVVLRVEVPAH